MKSQTSPNPISLRILYLLFAVMTLAAPLYWQHNVGGQGLNLPFNAAIWIPAVFIISTGLLLMVSSNRVVKPRFGLMMVLFPTGLVIGGFITGIDQPADWLLRLGAIVGGVLFWFSLIQFRLSTHQQTCLLTILCAGIGIIAIVGALQITPPSILNSWLLSGGGYSKTLGVFQQPNVNASMMATGALLGIYLITLPAYSNLPRWAQAIAPLAITLCTFSLMCTGSRAGLIGALSGLVFMLIARAKHIYRRKITMVLLTLTLGLGVGSGALVNNGLVFAMSKIDRVQDGQDARTHIYRIAWETFEKAPLIGHGIGSFEHEFQMQRIPYYKEVPNYIIDNERFSHPHNEILFWLIEGGLLALASILIAVVALLWQLCKLGHQRGLAYFALMTPILFHTQVELPFYISNLHWLVLLVLVAIAFMHGTKETKLPLSDSAKLTVTALSLLGAPLMTMFLVHTQVANAGLVNFLKTGSRYVAYLGTTQNDLYFNDKAELLLMHRMFFAQVERNEHDKIPLFIEWAKQYLNRTPDKSIYVELTKAYLYQGEWQNAIDIAQLGADIYPEDEPLAQNLKDAKTAAEDKNSDILKRSESSEAAVSSSTPSTATSLD